MVKQLAKYGTSLIALYLVVQNGSQAGKVMLAGAQGGSDLVRSFQGRK